MFPSNFSPQFPKMMYHADFDPRSVQSQQEADLLTRQGWSDKYIHREFPKLVYHADLEPKQVNNPTELDAALADGWSTEYEPHAVAGSHLPVPRAKGTKANAEAAAAQELPPLSGEEAQALLDENARLRGIVESAAQGKKAKAQDNPPS